MQLSNAMLYKAHGHVHGIYLVGYGDTHADALTDALSTLKATQGNE